MSESRFLPACFSVPLSMRRSFCILLAFSVIVPFGGCSSSGYPKVGPDAPTSGEPIIKFPDRQELRRYAEKRRPEFPNEDREVILDWTFEEQLATGTEPWDETLARMKADHPNLRTGDDLNCLAREIGRVFQEAGKLADDRFRRYAAARCGLGAPGVSVSTQSMHLQGEPSNAWIWSEMEKLGFLKVLSDTIKQQPNALGLAVVRGPKLATLSIVAAQEEVRLRGVTPDPEKKTVKIEGVTLKPIEHLQVAINTGEYDQVSCALLRDQSKFEASCPLDDSALGTWFEVNALEKEAVLSRIVARGLAAYGNLPATYLGASDEGPLLDEGGYVTDLTRRINDVRATAGRRPLRLESTESAEASYLLPYLEDAGTSGDREMENAIALGVLAGWNVKEDIRDGGLLLMSAPSRSPSAWLKTALDSPIGRSVLLSPENHVLSLGVHQRSGQSSSVLATTWELFGAVDHAKDRMTVLRMLQAERKRVGKSDPVIGSNLSELGDAAREVRQGKRSPERAVNRAADLVSQKLGREVWGMYMETYDLAQLTFPERLVSQNTLFVEVQVTHYKPKGAAWSQLAVLVLLIPGTDA